MGGLDFHGKYLKLIYEMELIGEPPIEAKRYEMLRRNVKNPYLQPFVLIIRGLYSLYSVQ